MVWIANQLLSQFLNGIPHYKVVPKLLIINLSNLSPKKYKAIKNYVNNCHTKIQS